MGLRLKFHSIVINLSNIKKQGRAKINILLVKKVSYLVGPYYVGPYWCNFRAVVESREKSCSSSSKAFLLAKPTSIPGLLLLLIIEREKSLRSRLNGGRREEELFCKLLKFYFWRMSVRAFSKIRLYPIIKQEFSRLAK